MPYRWVVTGTYRTRNERRRNWAGALIHFVCLVVLSGCAASGSRIADRAISRGDWSEAARLLQAAVLTDPADARAWAGLGECQYRLAQYDEARRSLTTCLSLDRTLHTAHVFLGYIAEADGDLDRALWHYQTFVDRRPESRQAEEVVRRMESLRRSRAQEFARHAIANEKELSPGTYSDSTIGVVYFRSSLLPDSLRPLAKGLAAMTVTDLSKVKSLRVVERLQTEELIKELRLSASNAFDSASAPRFGKLLGAAKVVGGELALLGSERLRIDPQIVSAKSGEVSFPGEQSGELSQLLGLQKRMVYSVLDQLGISPTLAERDSIEMRPAVSFDAFLAYSRGIDYEDQGLYTEAHAAFSEAVRLDPSFPEAKVRQRESESLIGAVPGPPGPVEEFAQATSHPTEWSAPTVPTDRRLQALLNNAGLVKVSADDTKTDDDTPYTAPAGGEAQVIIRGRFDE